MIIRAAKRVLPRNQHLSLLRQHIEGVEYGPRGGSLLGGALNASKD